MPTKSGGSDTRSQIAAGGLAESAQHVPHERRLALLRNPRLIVISSHHPMKTARLSVLGKRQHLERMKLLKHCGITNVGRRNGCGHLSIVARTSPNAISCGHMSVP